jgi:hypothetical protein
MYISSLLTLLPSFSLSCKRSSHASERQDIKPLALLTSVLQSRWRGYDVAEDYWRRKMCCTFLCDTSLTMSEPLAPAVPELLDSMMVGV